MSSTRHGTRGFTTRKSGTHYRNRYKKSYWRRDALSFLKNKHSSLNYGSWRRNFMYNVQHALPYKVGWTAKTAPVGPARAAQNRWKRAYFRKHGVVV